jgi:hypothetical protein
MRHVGDLPHRVMMLDVDTAQAQWHASKHPLYDFMCNIVHPDLDLRLPQRLAVAGNEQESLTQHGVPDDQPLHSSEPA